MPDKDLLSMKEAASALFVSMPTLYQILKRGELTVANVKMIGKQRRSYFSRADVEALRQKRKEQSFNV